MPAVQAIKDGFADKRCTGTEITNFRKDGRQFQNLLCIVPVMDAYDNLLKYVGIQCDLDEKRKRENVDEHYQVRWQEQVGVAMGMQASMQHPHPTTNTHTYAHIHTHTHTAITDAQAHLGCQSIYDY